MSVTLADLLDLRLAWMRVKLDIETRVFIRHPCEVNLIEQDLDIWLARIDQSIRDDQYSPSPMYVCDVPKEKNGIRTGNSLTLTDRLVYIACVGACLSAIRENLEWSQGKKDFSYQLIQKSGEAEIF